MSYTETFEEVARMVHGEEAQPIVEEPDWKLWPPSWRREYTNPNVEYLEGIDIQVIIPKP